MAFRILIDLQESGFSIGLSLWVYIHKVHKFPTGDADPNGGSASADPRKDDSLMADEILH